LLGDGGLGEFAEEGELAGLVVGNLDDHVYPTAEDGQFEEILNVGHAEDAPG
jgi:hypothetical protein